MKRMQLNTNSGCSFFISCRRDTMITCWWRPCGPINCSLLGKEVFVLVWTPVLLSKTLKAPCRYSLQFSLSERQNHSRVLFFSPSLLPHFQTRSQHLLTSECKQIFCSTLIKLNHIKTLANKIPTNDLPVDWEMKPKADAGCALIPSSHFASPPPHLGPTLPFPLTHVMCLL